MKIPATRLALIATGLLLGCLSSALAQTDAHALEQAWKNQRKPLRSYSADPIARFDWQNGTLAESPITIHTLGVFNTRSVKLNGGKLIVEGHRTTLVKDKKKSGLAVTDSVPMTIEIDLHGADPTTAFPTLERLLFFPDAASAIAALPEPVGDTLARELGLSAQPDNCKCFRFLIDGNWVTKDYKDDPLVKMPKPVYQPEPKFSDQARRARVSGNVILLLVIDDTGHPQQIWLTRPLGYGLDEAAETAVRGYIFEPGQYAGKPVGVALSVGVGFQMF